MARRMRSPAKLSAAGRGVTFRSADTRSTSRVLRRIRSLTSSNAAVSVNAWHHVAATSDGRWLKLFVNGVQTGSLDVLSVGSGQPVSVSNDRPLNIGSQRGSSHFLNGYMDDARIYSYSLPGCCVTKLFNPSSSCSTCPYF